MKKIQLAVAGAVLAASLGGGAAFGVHVPHTHSPAGIAVRHAARCQALLQRVSSLSALYAAAPGGSPQAAVLLGALQQAQSAYAAECP